MFNPHHVPALPQDIAIQVGHDQNIEFGGVLDHLGEKARKVKTDEWFVIVVRMS